MKKLLIAFVLLVVGWAIGTQTRVLDEVLPIGAPNTGADLPPSVSNQVPAVVERAMSSVVTVGVRTQVQNQPSISIGSGFVVDASGLVITNKHVVSDTDLTYEIIVNNGQRYQVRQIYRDPLNDLAILKVDAIGLQPLNLGDSNNLKLGEPVIAIGTPLGEFPNTVTSGIISGLGRGIEAGNPYQGFVEQLDDVIQTDAAINPGNSGGPLLNLTGQVIGVNTAVAISGQNLGFAIPVNVVRDVLEDFEARGGTFERPFIGVRYQEVTTELSTATNTPEGALVRDVVSGSPADAAGLQTGDVITRYNGQPVAATREGNLTQMIYDSQIGSRVTITIWRDGETFEQQIEVGRSSE